MSVIILQIDLALIASEKEIKGEKKKKWKKKCNTEILHILS